MDSQSKVEDDSFEAYNDFTTQGWKFGAVLHHRALMKPFKFVGWRKSMQPHKRYRGLTSETMDPLAGSRALKAAA